MEYYPLIFLFVYATLKAFLPLPSFEVVLIPMVIASTSNMVLYALIGAVGTFIGGSIGYWIAYVLGRRFIVKFTSEKQLQTGEKLIQNYGVLAIFIGGITPIPDFILAYLAGVTNMNYFAFAFSDALARLLRSLLVGFLVVSFGYVIDLDRWGTVLSLAIIGYLVLSWGCKKQDDE